MMSNIIPHEDREAYVYIRALSYRLVDWFFNAYEVSVRGDYGARGPLETSFRRTTSRHRVSIARRRAILDEYHPGVGEEDFQYQLMLCFEKEGLIMDLIQTAPDSMSLLWSFDSSWVISAKGTSSFESMFAILF